MPSEETDPYTYEEIDDYLLIAYEATLNEELPYRLLALIQDLKINESSFSKSSGKSNDG